MTERNIERLTELRDTLLKEKKRHNQEYWAKVKVKVRVARGKVVKAVQMGQVISQARTNRFTFPVK